MPRRSSMAPPVARRGIAAQGAAKAGARSRGRAPVAEVAPEAAEDVEAGESEGHDDDEECSDSEVEELACMICMANSQDRIREILPSSITSNFSNPFL